MTKNYDCCVNDKHPSKISCLLPYQLNHLTHRKPRCHIAAFKQLFGKVALLTVELDDFFFNCIFGN